MTQDEYNAFCQSLPHATHVVQWGDADVWKIGGKLFAIGGWDRDVAPGRMAVTFKVSDMGYEILRDAPGCRPAPYLASRGMKWIQCFSDETLSDEDLKSYIRDSYHLVAAGLTKKLQRELGF
ncbi:MmcQ/YjbR family DNA-binding protein [Woodsholea maritima]|uniref:MmcQ/YjbR family DNA-binding protein n=1 Tax=Woodsholea maritima TaxID=240237 RepID=UPI00036B66F1|nr:MmcQ/YjbR family DNA-binding protein [Woodsholea maritima]